MKMHFNLDARGCGACSVLAIALALGAPGVASAKANSQSPTEDADAGVGEIVVTAQHVKQNLQEVPLAVSALGSTELAQRGISSLASLGNGTVPGLTMYSGSGNPNLTGINIRGVTVADPGQGTADPGVAVYLDGVFLGRASGLAMELVDPERVEVLRGPQGTLFGRNAEGGAVQIVSAAPTGEFGGTIGGTFGDYGTRRGFVHLNLPETAKFSVKLDGLISHHDGWVKNPTATPALSSQKDFGINTSKGLRAAVRFRPSDDVTLDYVYDVSQIEWSADYWYRAAGTVGTTPSAASNIRPIDTARTKVSWRALWNGMNKIRTEGHSATLAYDVADALQIKSITAYRKLRDGQAVPTGGALNAGGAISYANVDQDQFSQEIQLTGKVGSVVYAAGFMYFTENVSDERISGSGISTTTALGIEPVVSTASRALQSAKSTSTGFYAQASWTPPILDERLELTAGLRVGKDKKTAQRTVQGGVVLTTPIQAVPFDYSPTTPAFAIKFKVTEDINVYARYAEGYRSGGVSVRSTTFRSYGAETAKTIEIGIKATAFDNRARLNVAYFNNRIIGLQATINDQNDVTKSDTFNIPGTYKVQGAEGELTLAPVSGLTLTGTLAYSDEEIPVILGAQLVRPTVPKWSGSASVQYETPETPIGVFVLRADYAGTGNWQRPGVPTGPFNVYQTTNNTNFRITLKEVPVLKGLELSAWMKNAFNTSNWEWTGTNGAGLMVNPRRIGMDAKISF